NQQKPARSYRYAYIGKFAELSERLKPSLDTTFYQFNYLIFTRLTQYLRRDSKLSFEYYDSLCQFYTIGCPKLETQGLQSNRPDSNVSRFLAQIYIALFSSIPTCQILLSEKLEVPTK
ncbi:hypothetical protein ACTXT7_016519, partial [Hymenolepis weldensis]